MPETITTDAPKRKRGGSKKGRPKPLGSGRKTGTPNRSTAQTRERIAKEADPIGFLSRVVRGVRMAGAETPGAKKKTWWYPTGDQRLSAAQTLARKVIPDMRATELSGPEGEPLTVNINLASD